MRHFTPWEFGDWYSLIRPDLLDALDEFRDQWGQPVVIRYRWDGPDVAGRLGRHQGPDSTSDHNVDRWGEVRGIDCFPQGMRNRANMERAIQLATDIGVTAIGVYPDWSPSPGLHLGMRPDRRKGSPATWGGIRLADDKPQQITSMVVALERAA